MLSPEDTKYGVVETLEDAKRCAALFRENRDQIDGVIVTLPNFGDERAIANTLRLADLERARAGPGDPDSAGKMTIEHRRDSFCGKMSACNNLRQYGIPYSLTRLHTVSLDSEEFDEDLDRFAATCRVVERAQEPARRQHRRAPGRFQHRALQREAARGQRHLGRDRRSVRNLRPHREARRTTCRRAAEARPRSASTRRPRAFPTPR